MATEGRVHVDRDHALAHGPIADLCAAADGLLRATPWRTVDLTDAASESDAIAWWGELTAAAARVWW